jgi:CHAT domain-containing protein/tetratricopeptide (TPR) repeat protein
VAGYCLRLKKKYSACCFGGQPFTAVCLPLRFTRPQLRNIAPLVAQVIEFLPGWALCSGHSNRAVNQSKKHSNISVSIRRKGGVMKSHAKLHWSRVVVAVVCLALFGLAQHKSGSVNATAMQAEEAALRAVVEKFYVAYGKKDLAGLLALWSEKSPDLAAQRKTLEQQFTGEDYRFDSPLISRVKVDGDKASLRVAVELTITNLQNKQSRQERIIRNFGLVKEGGEWKVSRYVPAVDDLVAAVAMAKSEVEQAKLLAEERELVTPELVRALIIQGNSFLNQGQPPQALAFFRVGQNIGEQINDQSGIASTLHSIGNAYFMQRNYEQSLEYYSKSLARRKTLNDGKGVSQTLFNIGNVYYYWQSNYARSLEYYQQSLEMSKGLGDQAMIARTLINVGNAFYLLGNYVGALERFHESLEMSQVLRDPLGTINLLNNLGSVYSSQGDYEQALRHLQESLERSKTLDNKVMIAFTSNNIGNVYTSQGNYLKALKYFQESLTLSKAADDKLTTSVTLNNIGNIHLAQGSYAQALECFRESLAIKKDLDNKAGVAITLGNIGFAFGLQNDHKQAMEHLQQSLAMHKAIGARAGQSNNLSNIGSNYFIQGNYPMALEYFQQSLTIKESLSDKAGMAFTLCDMGETYKKQGNYIKALDFAKRAVALAHQIGLTDTLWRAHLLVGTAYRVSNQPAQAREAFTDAISTIETIRAQVAGGEQESQRFFANKLMPYLAMVDLFLTENNPAEALLYAERANARTLLDVLHNGRVNITKAMTSQEQEQERKLNNQLTSLNMQIYREKLREKPDQARLDELGKQLQKPRLEYEAFETNLYAAHPDLKVRRGEAQMLTLEEARPLLPDAKTAVMKFVIAEEKSSLFVLTKSASDSQAAVEVKVFPIAIKQKDLEERVTQFRNQVAERDQAFARNATALFQLLLAPARPLLQGKTTLIIVPDGPLWELPFQALQSPESRYLLQDYAVFYAPSLTVLREMIKLRRQHHAPVTPPTLLAVGNPALGPQTVKRIHDATMDEKLGPLPAAQKQAEELGRLYGQQRSKVYTGAAATEERVKAESANYNILHLAAHGALNNRSPMYSHIVLSQMEENGKEDGLLEAWELMKLDLKADLAVLSACETARGRVVGGEGVIGLTWALFVAGCPTTVVSQWKVNDQSTADLMVEFHRRLRVRSASLDSRNSIAQALRQAALKLLGKSQYQHPYYWAGFIVVGDGY